VFDGFSCGFGLRISNSNIMDLGLTFPLHFVFRTEIDAGESEFRDALARTDNRSKARIVDFGAISCVLNDR
jgi:hypothetical protein